MTLSVADEFLSSGIVAILRGVPAELATPLSRALAGSGIRLIEVSLTSRHALEQISELAATLAGDAIIGAGTVTTRAAAEAAVGAGARFLVTPHVSAAVNAFGRERGLEVFGGAMTPTEIALSREQGTRFVKLFPAGSLGPDYLRGLLGPYPDAELVAVGGVDAGNAERFIAAGAVGIGVGGALTSIRGSFDAGRVAAVSQELVAAVKRGREARR